MLAYKNSFYAYEIPGRGSVLGNQEGSCGGLNRFTLLKLTNFTNHQQFIKYLTYNHQTCSQIPENAGNRL